MLSAGLLPILAIFVPLLLLQTCDSINGNNLDHDMSRDDHDDWSINDKTFNISIFTLMEKDDHRNLITKEIMKYYHSNSLQTMCSVHFGHVRILYNFHRNQQDIKLQNESIPTKFGNNYQHTHQCIANIIKNKEIWNSKDRFDNKGVNKIKEYASISNAALLFQQYFIDDNNGKINWFPLINDDQVDQIFKSSHDHIPVIITNNKNTNGDRNYLIIKERENNTAILYNFGIVITAINKLLTQCQ